MIAFWLIFLYAYMQTYLLIWISLCEFLWMHETLKRLIKLRNFQNIIYSQFGNIMILFSFYIIYFPNKYFTIFFYLQYMFCICTSFIILILYKLAFFYKYTHICICDIAEWICQPIPKFIVYHTTQHFHSWTQAYFQKATSFHS